MGMNIVRTKSGDLVHATQIKEDEVCFCPECGEEVMKKVSRNGVVFFAHIPKKHRQEETQAHQEGKHLLLESLKSHGFHAELEPYVSSIEQIPDIVVTEGKNAWCIEYQCSVISPEDIVERTKHLNEIGMSVQWILGENYESQHKLTDTFSFLMKYHPQLGNYLIFFVKGEMIFHTRIKIKPRSQQMTYQIVRVPLLSFSWKKWKKLVEDSVPVKAHLKPNREMKWTSRDTMLFKKLASPLTRAFLVKLYRCRKTIEDLPNSFLTFPIYTETFKVPNLVWKGYAWILLEQMAFGGDVEMMSFIERVKEILRPFLRPVSNPESQMEACIWEFIDELLADKKIKISYPKSKMNRLQKDGNFGKIFMSVEG